MKIAGIILAAGASRRMTGYKQLLTYDGKTFIEHVVAKLSQLDLVNLVCVSGHLHDELIPLLPQGMKIVRNKNHEKGMTSSLKLGLNEVLSAGKIDAVLIVLTDQPLIPATHYQDLYNKSLSSTKSIIATQYEGTLGVPVIFKKNIIHKLLSLEDTMSAKKVILNEKTEVQKVICEEAARDIDTDSDYNNFLKEL